MTLEKLDLIFAALANPTRQAILARPSGKRTYLGE